MKLSDIKKVFSYELSFKDFNELIKDEIAEFKKKLMTKGSSAPIYVIEDVKEITIGKPELKIILESFIKKEISDIEISYLADALTLSSRVFFESEDLQNDFESLTDPEINGALTKQKVRELLLKSQLE